MPASSPNSPERQSVTEEWAKLIRELHSRYPNPSLPSSPVEIPEDGDPALTLILANYTQPHRFYHTLTHIADLLRLCNDFAPRLAQPHLVRLAVLFHDVVYEPTRGDNEEASADLFHSLVQTHPVLHKLPPSDVQTVLDWVLKTKAHTTDEHRSGRAGASDLHYFLDFDMSVLGWQWEDYRAYAHQIRQEYIHIPEQVYRAKRAEVLESFLLTPGIFCTPEFKSTSEAAARSNIRREIDELLQHQ